MNDSSFQFEWDEAKAVANLRKHGISFELAFSVFADPQILTIPDAEHSEFEERRFSVGLANNGVPLTIVYLWTGRGERPNQDTANLRASIDSR